MMIVGLDIFALYFNLTILTTCSTGPKNVLCAQDLRGLIYEVWSRIHLCNDPTDLRTHLRWCWYYHGYVREVRVCVVDATRFMVDCLMAAGANRKAAEQQAELLIQADIFGHPSHGMNRLEFYVNDIISGTCEPNNEPDILKEGPSTAWMDAKNVLGATVSHIGMDLAISKAKSTGVGWVVVKGSHHNGIAGFWTKKAADVGLIGLAFTNTPPIMAPTRSMQAALGTNPIAVAAYGTDCELFNLDMATAAAALGKVEMQLRKGEPIPPGWAQGPDGKETLDADVAFKTRRLFPLGGLEQTSGYKGYGLGAMVELFCGITAGSNYGHTVPDWTLDSTGEPLNLSHCFGAIDPEHFAPGFRERLTDSMRHWRKLTPVDPSSPVLAPGDKERINERVVNKTGSVEFVQSQIDTCESLAKRLNVKPMPILCKCQ